MSATNKNRRQPSFEIHYRLTRAGDYDFVRSIYTPAMGDSVRARAGDFANIVGTKTTQICLLNLRLQLEGLEQADSSTQHHVLGGTLASSFAQILRKVGNAKWHLALFGESHQFLYSQGTSDPLIVIRGTHAPKKVIVQQVSGIGSSEKIVPIPAAETPSIISNLERQILGHRATLRSATSPSLNVGNVGVDSLAEKRAERAWSALEDFIYDIANPKTPSNKLYAIDRLNDAVWRHAETYAYFGHQAREYTLANYNYRKRDWRILFSPAVLKAIKQAVEIADQFLPNHDMGGHGSKGFDDWQRLQLARAGEPKFEIVRILIWPKERLLSQEAFAVIRLHKIYNIPLFYLSPDFVQEGPQDEYILFCKQSDSGMTQKRELRGLAWDSSRADWQHVRDLSYHAFAHFQDLLSHPKLVFAIDAREMLIQGKWDSLERYVLESEAE
jgi:hypothetical protein